MIQVPCKSMLWVRGHATRARAQGTHVERLLRAEEGQAMDGLLGHVGGDGGIVLQSACEHNP